MKASEIKTTSAYQTLLAACIQQFNPVFVVSADQKSICVNGEAIISNDPTIFGEGVFIGELGYQLFRHVNLEYENQPIQCMAHNLVYGIYPSAHRFINTEFVTAQLAALNENTKADLLKAFGYREENKNFIQVVEGFLNTCIRDHSIEHSDNAAIKAWLQANIDYDFWDLIKSGLRDNSIIGLHQYFEMAQSKEVITKFLAKYPHMLPMMRTVWEASDSAPERKIFAQLKTLADMEQGAFMVELYNQEYRHYAYKDCAQKFLADTASWQWLLTQPQKTIDIILKHYAVNDKERSKFAYHSFGRCRENLSLVAHFNIETKLAQVILKDLASCSIEHDRFAIDVSHNEKTLLKEEFHSGQRYRDHAKLAFDYMDSKDMDVDTRIKFLKTFKNALGYIGFEVSYAKNHTKTTLSDFEVIDAWVEKRFKQLDNVTKNTYVPDFALA